MSVSVSIVHCNAIQYNTIQYITSQWKSPFVILRDSASSCKKEIAKKVTVLVLQAISITPFHFLYPERPEIVSYEATGETSKKSPEPLEKQFQASG